MKKNLKKALSAVIALAVAVSMIPASFAAKLTLTDVADTASYATAVKTLVALDIINGYEDNSFKPDNLITRAETTKVVVAALNKIPAAEGMKGDTGFSDIEARHEWATGYINAGVLEGFINGMENNTFGPDLNVTYAQIVTMLVRALGYEDYAKYMGGWPNGYLAIGNSEGITKGVSAATNANVTRAQVAMLVYNALNTPIVLTTGMTYDSTAGGFVPHITKFDGTNTTDYKSLLTEKFEGYFVEGYITDNHNSDSSLDEDKVKFAQAYGEDYAEPQFQWVGPRATSIAAANAPIAVKVGFSDAANYNGSYVKVIIRENADHEWEFISVEPEKNVEVTVEAKNINSEDLAGTAGSYTLPVAVNSLKYFASSSSSNSTKYNLANTAGALDVSIYVNGNKVADSAAGDAAIRTAIANYILNNEVGTIKLVDTFQADGNYDAIYVEAYATAKISSINASTGKISLANTIIPAGAASSGASASITLDKDTNTKLSYHIYYNGEEIDVSDLKVDDIISISYDTTGTLGASDFYDIYVSRDTATGTLSTKIREDKTLVFGEDEYSLVGTYNDSEYKVGTQYTLYLDAFGRIFDYEEAVTVDRYAIVDRYRKGSDDIYKVYLYTAEGAEKAYAIDYNVAKITIAGTTTDLNTLASTTRKTTCEGLVGPAVYGGTPASWGTSQVNVKDRVVKYKVNTVSNKITELEFLQSVRYTDSAVSATANPKNFNERINSLDTIKMDASTKIIDAYDYIQNGYESASDLSLTTLDSFVDDKAYTAYAFGDRINNATIDPFVVVIAGPTVFDENARFAVVAGAPGNSKDADDNDVYTVPVYYKGESDKQNLIFTQDVPEASIFNATTGLKIGDVIVFETNSKGQVKKFYRISDWATAGGLDTYNYAAFLNSGLVNVATLNAGFTSAADNWSTSASNINNKKVTVLYGPIIGRNSKSITLGVTAANPVTYTTTAPVTLSYNVTLAAVSAALPGYAVGDTIVAGTPIPADVTINSTAALSVDQNNSTQYVNIGLTSSTNAYIYDYSLSKNRVSAISAASIPFNSFDKKYISGDTIYWGVLDGTSENSNDDRTNFAFVTVSEGVALDVFVLAAK